MRILIIGGGSETVSIISEALIDHGQTPFVVELLRASEEPRLIPHDPTPCLIVGAQDPPLDEQELAQARSFLEEHRLNYRHRINELILENPVYKVEELEELEPWVFESLREGWLKPPKVFMPQRQPKSVFKLNRFREWKEKKH